MSLVEGQRFPTVVIQAWGKRADLQWRSPVQPTACGGKLAVPPPKCCFWSSTPSMERAVRRRSAEARCVLWRGGVHSGCVHQVGVNWCTHLQRDPVMLKSSGKLVNIMSGQKTSALSGRYLHSLKPFNAPVDTAAQDLPQSFPTEIKPTVSLTEKGFKEWLWRIH